MCKLELSIYSELANVAQVENFIEYVMDKYLIDTKMYGKIALSTIEAVNNAILFGNKRDPHKIVKLTASRETEKIIITIEDEGEGFDYHNIPDPTASDRGMSESGKGLYLMEKLTDELSFEKNGAKVILSFLSDAE